jgi:predicted Fe-S protein YdhL (DUF1289 family)
LRQRRWEPEAIEPDVVMPWFGMPSEFQEGWNRSDDAAAAWDRMSERERQAYFKKVERLNKKSSKNRLKKRVAKPIKEMKLKPLLAENKDLVWAISYLEKGKDALYSYIKDDDRARREARRYFPIDDFLRSVKQNEGKEIADSDVKKIIMKLDDIILRIADSNREDNEAK